VVLIGGELEPERGKKMGNKIKRAIVDGYRIGLKDLLDFARDRMRLVMWIIMPFFMMVMMGYIFPSENVLSHILLGIVNQDQGGMGGELAQMLGELKMGESQSFILVSVDNPTEAKERIKKQELNGAVVIPEDFSAKIGQGEQANITIITDQSNPQISSLLSNMLERVMAEMSSGMGTQKVQALVPNVSHPEAVVKPFTVQEEGIVPGKPNYFQFMAPGIMAMVVMMAVMTGLAGSIARERELGTLDGILAAPISRLSIILGKSLSQTIRGLLQGMVVLVLAILLFGVAVHGGIPLVMFLLILGIFSFVGLGVLISAISTEQETAMTIMMTLQFPMIFLSGAFFPIQQMPGWLQAVSQVIPLTYAIQALRKVIILGAGLPLVTTEVIILASFGAVMLIVAVPLFNRAVTR
jgi:ABC-2 type transport system permease protein